MSSGSLVSFALIGFSVALSVGGQLVLKLGVGRIGTVVTPSLASMGEFFRQALFNPFVVAGFLMYGLSALLWLIVLSRLDLSYAYPFLALNFVLIALVSRMVLGESIPTVRWIGLVLICVGIVLAARS